jgi:guanylate kinase
MNKIFIVSSVSGSGKTTLVNNAIKEFKKDLYKLKTCTTREKRPEETGNEYYFIKKPEFELKIKEDAFVEYSLVYGEYYGLLKKEVDKNKEKNCIVILDVKGFEKFKKLYPNCVSFFIDAPAKEELIKRLTDRNTPKDDIDNRIKEIDYEIEKMDLFDFIIPYNELEDMKWHFNKLISFALYHNPKD